MFLGTPEVIRCPGCGYGGPPAPDAIGPLRHAAQLLAGVDQSRRQLSAAQRRTVLLGRKRSTTFVLIALLLAAPLTLCGVLGALLGATHALAASDVFILLVPLISFVGPVLLLSLWMRVARNRLERACSALPPAVPGEPASCYVCGGPLGAAGAQPLVRCAYCAADNLVEPRALARAGRRQMLVVESYEAEIERQTRATSSTAQAASALLVPAAIVVPIGSLIATLIVLSIIELPPLPDLEYMTVPTPRGACIALVHRDPGAPPRLTFGHSPPEGLANDVAWPNTPPPPFRAATLVGQTLVRRYGKGTGKVTRVKRQQLNYSSNKVVLVSADGSSSDQFVEGSCHPNP